MRVLAHAISPGPLRSRPTRHHPDPERLNDLATLTADHSLTTRVWFSGDRLEGITPALDGFMVTDGHLAFLEPSAPAELAPALLQVAVRVLSVEPTKASWPAHMLEVRALLSGRGMVLLGGVLYLLHPAGLNPSQIGQQVSASLRAQQAGQTVQVASA